MNRKSLVTVWLGVLALSIVMVGCPKKKPAPAPAEPAKPAPAQEVTPAPTPPVADATPDPLSEDIEQVNEYVYRQGLIGDVYFDFDKYDLKSEARERLAKNAEFMKANPQFTFTIEGHCDDRGTAEYNLALGERRANSALNYLSSLGVSSSGIRTISYGEERPQCTEQAESCWWRNRRAHFVITGRTGG
ncbi:MAG: peptidoglycan-associated lipoprotein Pal [Acidobacteriota bacterium]